MTLNGVIAVTLRYFSEVGKPALPKTICGGIYARVYCIFSACTMSSQRKFTFAISSPDEFLVYVCCTTGLTRCYKRKFCYIYICCFSTILYAISISHTCLRSRKSIVKPNFYKISQSTTRIKLFTV